MSDAVRDVMKEDHVNIVVWAVLLALFSGVKSYAAAICMIAVVEFLMGIFEDGRKLKDIPPHILAVSNILTLSLMISIVSSLILVIINRV